MLELSKKIITNFNYVIDEHSYISSKLFYPKNLLTLTHTLNLNKLLSSLEKLNMEYMI